MDATCCSQYSRVMAKVIKSTVMDEVAWRLAAANHYEQPSISFYADTGTGCTS